ncbi:Translation initiation factor 3 subunit J component [Lunasporangiospora selenospora]|uniref:Eukaryotic translation initiation factor 3 subunit J n=1 Tax=Lunasporangiospora selenospora TaxID=979761 RepID=A0A9P6G293_9FUNG|nr:Translation initiation factor 3 subunit J component [Lunasporangiospora selenospora]
MSDWENDDVIEAPVIPKKKQWDDEDVDEDDVKDEWDASSESEEEVKPVVVKAPKKTLTEKIAERNAEAEKRKQAALAKIAKIPEDETEEERFERRQREKNAIIQSDIDNASDLFSGVKVTPEGVVTSASKIETMRPKTKEDFNEFTTELIALIQKHEKQGLYVSFLEGLFRELAQGTRDVDVRKFASTLTTLANEKQKAAKDALKTKKKGGAKPTLASASSKTAHGVDTQDYSNDYNDDFDDFM